MKYFVLSVILVVLSGCTPPLTSKGDDRGVIREQLGESRKLLESGVYRIKIGAEFAMEPAEGKTLEMSEYFTAQWHERSKSYGTSLGGVQFFDFDGEYHVMTFAGLMQGPNSTFYLPVKVVNGSLHVLVYDCDKIPNNFRQARGIGSECEVSDYGTMLRALGLINFDELDEVQFVPVSPLPDFGASQ